MWSTQSRKATFINQFMKGSLDVREIDDIGDAAMNANEAVAIASGNPLVLEKAEVDTEVGKLERLRRSHQRSQSMLQLRIRDAEYMIPKHESQIETFKTAIGRRISTRGDQFTIVMNGRTLDSRNEAGDAIAAKLYELIQDRSSYWKELDAGKIGSLGGFDLHARNVPNGRSADAAIVFPQIGGYEVTFTAATLQNGGIGIVVKLENAIEGLDRRLVHVERELATALEEKARSEARLGLPFERQEQLDRLKVRKRDIDIELQGVPESPAEERSAKDEPETQLQAIFGAGMRPEHLQRNHATREGHTR
jgi:hypothetical protein